MLIANNNEQIRKTAQISTTGDQWSPLLNSSYLSAV